MQWIYTFQKIKEAAIECWAASGNATVLAFHGPVGVGKTTLIHALCDSKNVKDAVGSPTFSIINEYVFLEKGTEKKIYHIDLYRLKDEEEAIRAGIEDCLYNKHICLIEWPEKITSLLPANTLHLYMEVVDANTRRLILKDK